MKNDSYIKGEGIKAISSMPNWVIKFIGWVDSHKSPDVAVSHLDKYLAILAKNEKDEALLAASELSGQRAQGKKHVNTILRTDADNVPDLDSNDNSPAAKRSYSSSLAEHRNKMAAIKSAKDSLPEIDAAIIFGNLVFEERLEKTRDKGMSQINVYIKGVRYGKHHAFAPEIILDDKARLKYYAAHKEIDDLIHQYAEEGKNEK